MKVIDTKGNEAHIVPLQSQEAQPIKANYRLRRSVAGVALVGLIGGGVAVVDWVLGAHRAGKTDEQILQERIPMPEDQCTLDFTNRLPINEVADRYAEGSVEIVGTSGKISAALRLTGIDLFAVCNSPDYPGSGNKIMLPENVPASQLVPPEEFRGFTTIG